MSRFNSEFLKSKGKILTWIGAVLLVLRFLIYLYPERFVIHGSEVMTMNFSACCLRMGLILLFLGLAWETVIRIPVWLFAVVPISVLILVFRPRIGLYLIPLIVGVLVIQRSLNRIELNGKRGRKRRKK